MNIYIYISKVRFLNLRRRNISKNIHRTKNIRNKNLI